MNWNEKSIERLVELRLQGKTWKAIAKDMIKLGLDVSANNCRKAFYRNTRDNAKASAQNLSRPSARSGKQRHPRELHPA